MKNKSQNNFIFIGDNLEVMKSNSFNENISEVDTIYIDPPYNTKRKFSYEDKKEREDWLRFMEARLEISRSILRQTGCIFISIDDNEYAYLKVLCDKIYGEKNFVGSFITFQSQRSNAKHINTVHEYVLCYAKDKTKLRPFKIKRVNVPEDNKMIKTIVKEVKKEFNSEGIDDANKKLADLIKKFCFERNITWLKNYNSVDEKGNVYFGKDLSTPSKPREVNIPEINLHLDPLPTRGWSSDKKFIDLHNQGKLAFKGSRPYEKHLLIDAEENASSVLNFYSRQGTNDLNKLGLRNLFDTPKPVELIKYLIRISTPSNGVVLDFFAGSGTTGQAVYETNAEDNTERKFVLVQLDEAMDKNSEAYKKCVELDIKPDISEALIFRIETFLKKHDMTSDVIVERRVK